MNYKYDINKDFNNFKDFLLNIKEYFNTKNNYIHKARNELKIIPFKDLDTVVKSFKVPNIINKIAYTFFRDSKAKKSYEYSLKIGDFTPKPIGYIEFYENFLLNESYFISEKFDYDFTIREPLLDKNFSDRENIFRAFARFTYQLHQHQILHKDYSPGNILIKKENNDYTFKVVDINRMEFHPLSIKECLQNFDKLWAKDDDLTIMIQEYANISDLNVQDSIEKALYFSQKLKNFKNMKKRLKGKPVVD
ncbi:lipopolysaccharide kinase InaA family protein [Sulfurimonas sp. C5]|uniref:lipopolysaccharide kinase InaA family protein n=1 Tax=Sulfurimonas sp. C5 TaxID=3036947 RepID=UPI00245820ED|nr:lipopolysaccharide kinase InaA family protein [Sulfurimonas sp. C5]MDH4945456.1 lipopolysaccharide kinase InaA family protein [Sulfurimonas sp. C5]